MMKYFNQAYHKQAKLYHPDKNPGDEGEEKVCVSL